MIGLDLLGPFIETLKAKYRDREKIVTYLENVKEEILTHLDEFKTQEEQPAALPFLKMPKQEPSFIKYSVNVIVNNGGIKGAPVVFESNPTYLNLFGRIEYKVSYGMASTDFTMIKAGSVHRANGGYLVIDTADLFKNAFSYDALKRALKNREIKIEDILEQYRLISTASLKPESIPLDAKVILTGSPYVYYILHSYDEESRELFKVKADFDSRMERTPENMEKYAAFIAQCQKKEHLLPIDRTGVAKIIEYSSRYADSQDKMTTKFSAVNDLIREAHYWAKKAESDVVRAEDVDEGGGREDIPGQQGGGAAPGDDPGGQPHHRDRTGEGGPDQRPRRARYGRLQFREAVEDYRQDLHRQGGDRQHRAGNQDERQDPREGHLHHFELPGEQIRGKEPHKPLGVHHLRAALRHDRRGQRHLRGAYALLSSISGVPLKQSFAVTGSMDQNGDVQPIGGVNQKVEGFFDLCKMRGLDGSNGVIIPSRNRKNLMLREDIRQAVDAGTFSLYTIDRMEEGLEILTGMTAGELKEDGDLSRRDDQLPGNQAAHRNRGSPGKEERRGKPDPQGTRRIGG